MLRTGGISDGPKANTISGTIYDANGNKFHVPGATVIVHALGEIGSIGDEDAAYNIPMDDNSHFEAQVKNGLYKLHARAFMQLNSRKVCIDVAPADGKPYDLEQASKPGIVKDYKLMLTGLAPGGDTHNVEDYYGAHIYLTNGAYNFSHEGYWNNLATAYPGAIVYFNLDIQSPLIDGSQGQSQQLQASVEDLKTGQWYINVPFAAYRVTAMLVTANGSQVPLKLNSIGYTGSDVNARYDYLIDLTFPPNSDDMDGHPIEPEMAIWAN